MRIVHWDEMFHPNFGYQINILPVYQRKQGHEVIILTAEKPDEHPTFAAFAQKTDIAEADRRFSQETGVKIIRLPIYGVVSGRVIYKPGYLKKINSLKPDVVMCHTSDTLSAMTIIWNHKRICAPLVFDNHMLEMASENKLRALFRWCYTHFVTPVIKKNRFVTIRTQDDPYVMKCLKVPEELAPYISFGTDSDLFCPDAQRRAQFREELGIPENAFVILYAGKLSQAKGGLLLAQALEKKLSENKEVVAVVVGTTENNDYGHEIDRVLANSENRILRFGTQHYRDLPKFYQISDLALFAKQCSLSYFDVQATELPVILEDAQVNIDRVQAGNGYVFKAGNLEDFVQTIRKCVEMPAEEYEQMKKRCRENVLRQFDYNDIARQYTDILISEKERQEQARSKKRQKR